MYSFHESLIPFSSTISLPDKPLRQFDPVISCLSFTICFAIRKISFCWLGSFRSLAISLCFFPFANKITFFVFCLLFWYSSHASVDFSLLQFPYFFFFSLTASAISSFHHHVSLCLHAPFDNPHVTCTVSIIIFFICWPMFIYISAFLLCFRYHIFDHALVFFTCFSSLSFHTCTLGSNFLRRLFLY